VQTESATAERQSGLAPANITPHPDT
jgi:hypothetical protein